MALLKGRGAQINTENPFAQHTRQKELTQEDLEEKQYVRTEITEVFPKTIVNKIASPDVGMAYSINPYQGCEHGCVYCYARNSHTYWGYSAGLDFERKIMVKKNAPDLLRKFLIAKNWNGTPIAMSGNTDCYQPIEKKLEITRKLLQTFADFEHPTAIISKSNMVLRDMDIIQDLVSKRLFKAAISLNTLDDRFRQKLEPRAASVQQRIRTIKELAAAGVHVRLMVAPVIPGLNSHEIVEMVKQAADWGVSAISYIVVRMNGDVSEIFSDWLDKAYPDRAAKVLNQVRSCHGGQLNDSRFGLRMRGEGQVADIINKQFKVAKSRYLPEETNLDLDSTRYLNRKDPQLNLF